MMFAATDRGFRVAMYTVVTVAVVAFAAFVYGYPKLFPYIVQADPENYRHNVEKALAKGDLKTALRVARYATDRFGIDPEPYVLHAELLLGAGATAEARQQLEKAVSLTTSAAPEYRHTRLPYYHPRARLVLGAICWGEGDATAAVTHFELARPLANLHDDEYVDFHKAMYQAYAAVGAWSRAIEFGGPSLQQLSQLDRVSLVSVMAAAEGMQQWELLGQAGRALLSKDTRDPAGHAAVGRTALAFGNYDDAVAPLTTAAEFGDPNAPFFLGLAHAELNDASDAAAALMSTARESIYYPFALALALEHVERGATGPELESLRQHVQEALAACAPARVMLTEPLRGGLRWIPEAIGFKNGPVSGNSVAVVIRWRDTTVEPSPAGVTVVGQAASALLVRYGNTVFHLQWAANMLPFGDFESIDLGNRSPAGWVDFSTASAASRSLPAAEVVPSVIESGRMLQVVSPSAEKNSLIFSVPVTLRPGTFYVLSGRMYAPDTKAVFGWEFLGEDEHLTAADNAVNGNAVSAWSSVVVAAQARYPSTWVRAILGIFGASGTAAYDDVALLELVTPQ